ncbi:MAG: SDR family oxidoreductase [Desulfovibrio sp.]|nr:SDR family oxidoreductase [Desulfovibrio sp.]
MDLELDGRAVLVTGSSRGIGLGVARALLREGAQVILTARGQADLDRAAALLGGEFGRDRVHAVVGDLLDPDRAEAVAVAIRRSPGRLDHLVLNIGSGRSVPVLSEDKDEFQRLLSVNLLPAVVCVRAFLPLLRQAAGHPGTGITMIGSICGQEALGCPAAYAAAKSALTAYARDIARPLGREGIRVNVVNPGNVLFPGSTWENKLAAAPEAVADMLDREVPLNRLGSLDEVADVVAFLASARAGFVSGAVWTVDGGQTRGS